MKRIVFAACGLIVGVSFAGVPVELKNAGFHETDGEGGAVGWSRHPNWHAEKAGHNGSGGMVWECASAAAFERGGPGQRVTLKPGKRYDFHALVKTEGVVTQRKSIYQGLTVCVECYGADGKMMFYDMARPTASGTSDWTSMSGTTREIPDGVAEAYLRALAKQCVSGRAVFDNMYLAEHDTPTVEGVFPHVYRRESTGGPVRFSASINADVHENKLEDYAVTFTYMVPGGAMGSSRPTVNVTFVTSPKLSYALVSTGLPVSSTLTSLPLTSYSASLRLCVKTSPNPGHSSLTVSPKPFTYVLRHRAPSIER
jgi:hypothetical protein